MTPWSDAAPPPPHLPRGLADHIRFFLRACALALLVAACVLFLLLLRLIERPLFGLARPFTPYITRFVARIGLHIIGLRFRRHGHAMKQKGALVANHAGWLDIFALNAADQLYFVSKAEVARWPVIGFLARSVGTVFITRNPKAAAAQKALFEARLGAGHRLLFFPEGTSTDGLRVLSFKPTLFAAFFTPALQRHSWIQPVSVVYHAPQGADPRIYSWWGDMNFADHMTATLAAARHGMVEVVYHPPLRVADFADRKALAAACEKAVREGLAARLAAG